MFGQSMPNFMLGLAMLKFAAFASWIVCDGYDYAYGLPANVRGIGNGYVRSARSKGIWRGNSSSQILYVAIQAVTLVGLKTVPFRAVSVDRIGLRLPRVGSLVPD